ncbi:citrate lyase beta subunit [Bacillus oleivorans]|uniref:Citrate lyase beta subunit n=1 Tax=Bacillus oleivorans TaxID=1448271 RepID=A0A285CL31_9BACI|nr:HpcH/HpaI aldolase/citrate lyase family protein [Bacillus oleivorans]SNX68262.1 citrate lyase beta subunit [Bacillus oleivorans]
MQYFSHISKADQAKLFYKMPQIFSKSSARDELQYALGAALYMPATIPNIRDRLFSGQLQGLTTAVICLEDAISDGEVKEAEIKLIREIKSIHSMMLSGFLHIDELPLLFLRVRSPEQLEYLVTELGTSMEVLTGIAIPKFSTANGLPYLQLVRKVNDEIAPLYALPILESKQIIFKDTRYEELKALQQMFSEFREIILNIRIGATDFSGLYGIRRPIDSTIYDIAVVRDVIADIINYFGREENYFTLSAPVWEFFSKTETLQANTNANRSGSSRQSHSKEEDGLIREVLLDIANGLIGKTVIHPSHIGPVQALQAVSYENYMDASTIINGAEANMGVLKSQYANKMNETKPHRFWAEKIIKKSKIYGVLYEERTFDDLLWAATNISYSEKLSHKS